MLIGKVAALSEVSKDTVKLYTRKGLIQCSFKKAGSTQYADYDQSVVEFIQGIKVMQSLGFSLAEIKPLATEYAAGKIGTARGQAILKAKLHEIESKQQHLTELATSIQSKLNNHSV
jgi:DNA-binding transcriptional MerR regulator